MGQGMVFGAVRILVLLVTLCLLKATMLPAGYIV